MFAEGITAESAAALGALARKLWADARSAMIAEATSRYDADRHRNDATCRIRFGTYFWSEICCTDPSAEPESP